MSSSTSSSSESRPEHADARAGVFICADLRAEVAEAFPVSLGELRRVIDPAAAEETVHWGRNYVYRTTLHGPAGETPVVVKAFREESARQRLQRRCKGSKAKRSFDASRALLAAGVPVPGPVAAVESTAPRGPSFFVSVHLEGAVEARYLFRAMNAGRERELFPEVDGALVLARLGALLRRLHAARLWHRDVSGGNVLLAGDWSGGEGGDLYLVDLGRTRIGRALSPGERMRDLARLPLHRPGDRQNLLEFYLGRAPAFGKRALFGFHHHAFHLRNRLKDRLRGARRVLAGWKSRSAHPHIPPPSEGAATRDRVVWDPLSDQPHLHAGRTAKLYARAGDAAIHVREAAVLVRHLPAAVGRWRVLRRELYEGPQPFGEAGVGVHGGSAPGPELLAEIEALGVRCVLLRLQPWEERLTRDQELCAELHARGLDVVLAVAQNRDLVRDPARWRAALGEIADRFAGLAGHVQVGHAINRSKWGVWNQRDYAALVGAAAEILGGAPGMRLLGPSVIDFEPHATCIALNWPENRVRFDVVSSLLYVDRRGAPENRQAGLDTVDKAALLRATIQTSRDGDRPSWITEVNWPLREGPHSPAGRHVAVGEEAQADYLARYHLLLLGSGLVERVYWWQLVARGYGLAERGDAGLRRRPSWRALAFLVRSLSGSRALGPSPAPPPLRVHGFQRADGSSWLVAWSAADNRLEWRPHAVPRALFDRDGRELPIRPDGIVAVSGSPVYAEMPKP